MDTDTIGSLERLSKLRESGHLTPAEFEEQKRRLIAAPPSTRATSSMSIIWLAIAAAAAIAVAGSIWMLSSVRSNEVAKPKQVQTSAPRTITAPPALPVKAPLPPASPPAALAWVGKYEGSFDGATGSMSVVARGPDKIDLDIGMGAARCVGGITFKNVRATGQTLRLTKARDESGLQCKISLKREGSRVRVNEDGCMTYHGFECAFDGVLTKNR